MNSDAGPGRLIYEVNLFVEASIVWPYRQWLDTHVTEMLSIDGFESAEVLEVLEPSEPGWCGFSCRYRVRNRKALDAYLSEHATRMRAEGVARFGDQFKASRRVLMCDG